MLFSMTLFYFFLEENVSRIWGTPQNLKNEVGACEEKLDTLLDAHLEKTITGEEYTAKKNKILARKIDIEQKLKDFERKGNRWLERTRNFILAAHQANSVALGDNFSEKKNYLEKVGSNPQLAERAVSVSFRNDWQILAEFNAERRSREATFQSYPCWLGDLESNQDSRLQRPLSYR
ncbi:MAG: Recombinase [Candidatus Nomurabacteria bacterium GW2011_GWA1_37_20]|uniref:Recombinase n=1 Tax=Candidatus Nomurabacteria bacterium GW2011_GWA1_37_20 TaxID=1618729 RepID=A0A0G0GK20_9BACT|nr:MAG: Recombinase [Candidatus Nomurabacteria bacterium GW2011_GWA1_37_20]